ncbi:MAG: amino acid racemase [Bacteroidetes bacterium]|jgi:aspartate racemase|nr:amino acid racemase [Bacteroidota bacterium]MBT6685922.1 amino acid racemase [Bacteroidota bacterium]MBT7143141.1 amino acid racemase [Bacteroidota bacterium]MBT7491667.1 amino acid racemase [Bacteroidota bacterium]
MKTLGIIGGLGPETTSEFYLDIIFSSYQKSKKERPGIIIASVPLPYEIEEDLIMSNKGTERYLPYLVEEAKRVERAGSDFIVMPCNSLHMFIDEIRNAVNIPVLSIVEETVKFLRKNDYKKVGIISTSATIQNKLYENAFEKVGITYELPDDFQQAKMWKFILNLVTGRQKNSDREELINIIDQFEKKDVDCVVLACTDLQLLIPKHPNLKIFDTMKIFANSTVEYIFK